MGIVSTAACHSVAKCGFLNGLLVGATPVEQANAVLEAFRPDHNRRFAINPADASPAWRAVRRGTDLARICSFHYEATVLPDNTVRLGGMVIDVPPGPRTRSYAGTRIEVHQFLDGGWRVYWGADLIDPSGHDDHGVACAQAPPSTSTERSMEREPCGERAQDRASQRPLAFFPSLRAWFDQGGVAKRRAKGKDGLNNPLGKEKKKKHQKPEGRTESLSS